MLSLGVLKMNKVWTALLVIGIVVSFLTGSIDKLGTVIVESATDAFNIFLKVALLILFWNGVFNIAIQSGLIKNITKFLFPKMSHQMPSWIIRNFESMTIRLFPITCSNMTSRLSWLLSKSPVGMKS